jgi:agmatinase
VEVAPAYDWADQTVNNAHRVVMELFAALASKKRTAAEGQPEQPDGPDPA